MKKTIFYISIYSLFLGLIVSSCDTDIYMDEKEEIVVYTSPNLLVNKTRELSVDRVEIELYEGHSHAPKGSQKVIGEIMWCDNFVLGNRNFHGSPYNPQSQFPLKAVQKLIYQKQGDGTLELSEAGDSLFSIQSASPRERYQGGVMYALIVRLYDKDGKRLDQELKLNAADRTQVFYQVKSARPTFAKHVLSSAIKDTTISYFWYYDRLPVALGGSDSGDYFSSNPVGFRGVIQALDPYMRFNLQMSVSLLLEDETKLPPYGNSVLPKQNQIENIVFQLNIPFRTVVPYPDFEREADRRIGYDWYDDRWVDGEDDERHKRYRKEAEDAWYQELHETWPQFSVQRLKELHQELRNMDAESGTFYL